MDLSFKRKFAVFLVVLFSVSALATAASSAPPLVNWTPQGSHRIGTLAKEADVGGPGVFITIAPCRQYNSLNSTPLLQATNRTVPLTGAPCSIPAAARAVSVNITVFNIIGASGNGVFKVDTVSPPTVAWVNYPPTETQRANAGTVALASGNIIVQVAQGAGQVDFIVDTNGYYLDGSSAGVLNTGEFFGIYGNFGNSLMFSDNFNATGNAIRGYMNTTSAGAAGVIGEQAGASGAHFGVWGRNASASSDSAAVLGSSIARTVGLPTFFPTGVRGESTTGNGMVGFINNTGSINFGVAGFIYSTTGTQVAAGRLGDASGPLGVSYSGGLGGSGTKAFFEPHPTDATKMIRYISIEGPEAGVYFRGTGTTVNGIATIQVPETFSIVADADGLTVQLTPTGRQFAMMTVQNADLNSIVVRSSKDVTFHYLVQGVRRAYKDIEVVTRNFHFVPESPDAKVPASLSAVERQRLIANGTYNEDGTVNMATAERAGWAATWRDQETKARAAATSEPQPSSTPNRQ